MNSVWKLRFVLSELVYLVINLGIISQTIFKTKQLFDLNHKTLWKLQVLFTNVLGWNLNYTPIKFKLIHDILFQFNEFIIISLNYNFSLKSNLKIIIVDSSFHLEFILKVFPQCLETVALIYLRYLACKNKVYKKSEEGKYENQKLFFCSFCNKHYIFYLFVEVEHEEYKTTTILTRQDSFHNMGQQQQKLQ